MGSPYTITSNEDIFLDSLFFANFSFLRFVWQHSWSGIFLLAAIGIFVYVNMKLFSVGLLKKIEIAILGLWLRTFQELGLVFEMLASRFFACISHTSLALLLNCVCCATWPFLMNFEFSQCSCQLLMYFIVVRTVLLVSDVAIISYHSIFFAKLIPETKF